MSNLIKYDPFAELNALQRRFFGDDLFLHDAAVNIPTTDVYEKNGDLVVEAHLPNYDRDDVDIQVDGDNLVISAERHEKEEDKDGDDGDDDAGTDVVVLVAVGAGEGVQRHRNGLQVAGWHGGR